MSKRRVGTCPHCGRQVGITKAGHVVDHRIPPSRNLCPGTRMLEQAQREGRR